MTHKDIYTKYMIEYDKANVTSSYPSFTEYEVATILDKAYLALIAQKVTGNNPRRSPFESDVKAVADIQPLVKNTELGLDTNSGEDQPIINVARFTFPTDCMYSVQISLEQDVANPYDKHNKRYLPCKLVPHEIAEKFFITPSNMPWIKTPICFIENNKIFIAYDPINIPNIDNDSKLHFTYIQKPQTFVNKLTDADKFELSDSMAEELINLAIAFSLENVESSRLNTKLNTRGLEA